MKSEISTDLNVVGSAVSAEIMAFTQRTGRQLQLEIEPGTFLVAEAGCLLSTVQDIVSTHPPSHPSSDLPPPPASSDVDAALGAVQGGGGGSEPSAMPSQRFDFLKLDCGMTEVLRPSL